MRGGYLVCPGCGGQMMPFALDLSRSLEGGDVQRCQNCEAVWFDWFDGETSNLATRVPIGDGLVHQRAGGACPRDGARLEAHPYLDAGPSVERCPECLGLFAGRAQLAALAEFHAHMPESSEPIERSSLLERLWHAFGR